MKMTKRCLALVLALLLALGAVGALASVKINKTNFPDANFREYIRSWFDTNGDGKLDKGELNEAQEFYLGGTDIKNLKGIEFFTKLTGLEAGGNYLKKVDLRKNTSLEYLSLNNNSLTSLKLGNQKKLALLRVDENPKLKTLDVGGCPILKKVIAKQLTGVTKKAATYGYDGNQPIVWTNAKITLMNGSKVLRKYGKPKGVGFSEETITLKKGWSGSLEELGLYIKMKPATVVYPTKITSSNNKILSVEDDGEFITAKKKGTVDMIVTSGGKKGTVKVIIK